MQHFGIEIESLEELEKRLHICGSGEKLRAAIEAVKVLKSAHGDLDDHNQVVAPFHLTSALVK
jgi:hypothetical protein